jgi:hypothetical protein
VKISNSTDAKFAQTVANLKFARQRDEALARIAESERYAASKTYSDPIAFDLMDRAGQRPIVTRDKPEPPDPRDYLDAIEYSLAVERWIGQTGGAR